MKSYLFRFIFLMLMAWSGLAMAHALPQHSVPAAGATLAEAPQAVIIYFDAELEPVFSTLIVRNAQGSKVSHGNGMVMANNPRSLEAKLIAAGKGAYHVYWNVVSHDGHRAQGDFIFTVR